MPEGAEAAATDAVRQRLSIDEMVLMQHLVTYTIPDLRGEGNGDLADDLSDVTALVRRLIGAKGPGPRRND